MKEQHKIKSVTKIELIEILIYVGKGTEKDPYRLVCQLWDFEGNLVSVIDPYSLSQ